MIEKLIKKTARQLDQQKIPYMIIGGQAVLLYGRPRLTRDIDITLGIDTDKFDSIEEVCTKLKLRIQRILQEILRYYRRKSRIRRCA